MQRATPPPHQQAGAGGHEAITKRLLLVLRALEGAPHEVPVHSNCSSAVTEDLIAHYLEGEFREARGETRGCLGYAPHRLKKV